MLCYVAACSCLGLALKGRRARFLAPTKALLDMYAKRSNIFLNNTTSISFVICEPFLQYITYLGRGGSCSDQIPFLKVLAWVSADNSTGARDDSTVFF